MKKLLYITNAIDGSGGLERVLSVKTKVLAEDFGYEIHIITLNQKSATDLFFPFSVHITQHNIEVSGNPFQYISAYISGIKKVISAVKPNVILVCDDGLKAFFLPKILGNKIPIIYERHVSKLIEISDNQGFVKNIFTKLKFSLMDFLAQDFTRFIVLTDGNKNEWKLKNLQVIPNPLPFFPVEKSKLQNKKVIAVGKQSYQKSYDRLLKSWALLDREFHDWELHIYGKFDNGLGLEDLAQNLKIESQVYFHLPEKNIEEKYAESSIFVLSSRYEGFGMVLIEAMSFGMPCVSFDCHYGPSDIIKDGEDGFLVKNGDEKTFAEKLQWLMKDENLRQEMGEKARVNVERFLPKNVVGQWDKVFRGLGE
ncbi:glycosyl transferase [Cloacibacterium rupense]|uniref:Glycosyl transferase n=1 Tax=Cloacibacterium rupense TaxID=517423 RepID=A0ABQ2NLT4_9FLAO|nr:glycosyltransferase family 4 protein [Cloacibacterium rupense]GGP06599.1 glycosyl transferase [Cloacibacterium rupense]